MDILFIVLVLVILLVGLRLCAQSALNPKRLGGIVFFGGFFFAIILLSQGPSVVVMRFIWSVQRHEIMISSESAGVPPPVLLPTGELKHGVLYSESAAPNAEILIDWHKHPAFSYKPSWATNIIAVVLSSLFAGLFTIVRAILIQRLGPRPLPGHCTTCGYDQRGSDSCVCSECGVPPDKRIRIRKGWYLSFLVGLGTLLIAIRTYMVGVVAVAGPWVFFVGDGGIWVTRDQPHAQRISDFYSEFTWLALDAPTHVLPLPVESGGPFSRAAFGTADFVVLPFWCVMALMLLLHVVYFVRPFRTDRPRQTPAK